jgi:hypothetical protein
MSGRRFGARRLLAEVGILALMEKQYRLKTAANIGATNPGRRGAKKEVE